MSDGEATTEDGRTLHYERHGEGAPVVVCEAGMGLSRNSWGAVVPRVAASTTIVIYDRSGLGRSAPDPARRDLARLASDLNDLLDQLDPGPFVLVGHSWGGPIVRRAAARQPERIVGLVLVDQSDENCDLYFTKAQERQQRFGPAAVSFMGHSRLLRLVMKRLARPLPEPWASAMRAEDGTVAAAKEQVAELDSWSDDLRRLRDDPLRLPDVPVTVISGGRTGFLERGRREPLVAAHRATAAAARRGRHVMAEKSAHYVPLTDPEIVADEILRVVAIARR